MADVEQKNMKFFIAQWLNQSKIFYKQNSPAPSYSKRIAEGKKLLND
jgi:hypothetical protein